MHKSPAGVWMNQQWEMNPENEMKWKLFGYIIQRYSLKSHVNNIRHDYSNHSVPWNVSPLEYLVQVLFTFFLYFIETAQHCCRLRRNAIESLIPVRNENLTNSLSLFMSSSLCVKTQETAVQSFIQMLTAPKPHWRWIIDRGQITKSNECRTTRLWTFKWASALQTHDPYESQLWYSFPHERLKNAWTRCCITMTVIRHSRGKHFKINPLTRINTCHLFVWGLTKGLTIEWTKQMLIFT